MMYVDQDRQTLQVLRQRAVTLTLRGFSAAPQWVAALSGVEAHGLGSAGQVRRLAQAPLKRSYVSWRICLPPSTSMFAMVPMIVTHLGGEENIQRVLREVVPEFVEVDLLLPVKNSPEQEGGFIANQDLACLTRLGATLAFSFLSHLTSDNLEMS